MEDQIKQIDSMPIDKLVSIERNMYELTNAVIHRAHQISISRPEELERTGGKIVTLAIQQIFYGEVEYQIKQE